ncbi:hypothetical protein BO94DRAFT_537125 [Aspergillus sclerotioniger CBS 115572]|uniref:Uncharacterized protein n=1 Tax=Aspergillus sclerotioniger CBS 115572 TaxID=1450535 RepID=A0A317W4N3_9EURO|nr:hypothetical protein BO94DRAFT_537125 [Aspergillus sclerotioniger CBS 115572]PWY80247.1 hypothetical protein BO94DRAFT_537125 [Aspergillus sclerotioniger CBS 115572]
MSSSSLDTVAAQYKNYSIYVLLSSRGAQPGFHWGIFIPTNTPAGRIWHATDREGGWKLDPKPSANVPYSMSLVLAYRIGSIDQSTWETCTNILNGVAADGKPSPNTGEAFSCRVWVKDAIIALQNNRIIELKHTISELEAILVTYATDNLVAVEKRRFAARVENSST